MQIDYITYRKVCSHEGECSMERVSLCFGCAVKAVMRDEVVEDIITENYADYYCFDCAFGG